MAIASAFQGRSKVAAAALFFAALASAPDAAAVTWEPTAPTGGPPVARYSPGGADYDAAGDRLILFSGAQATPGYPTDTWVLSNATELGGASAWTQLATTGGPPAGRYGHSLVYAPAGNRAIVYGGCLSSCGLAASDTWVLSNANGTGGSPVWSLLATSGADNRESHSAVYDAANNRMIVFGGQNGFNTYGGNPQVRVLTNADGSEAGTPTWTTLSPAGTTPSNRELAAVVYDAANNRLVVMGGLTLQCCASIAAMYNDVWVLENANGLGGTPQWTQLTPSGTPPAVRYGHSGVYDAGSNRLIVFGGVENNIGSGTFDATFDDVWVLENANGLGGTPAWTQLTPSGGPPDARWGHARGYNPTYDAMVVAMGRRDNPTCCPLFNDAWVLEDANGVSYDYSGFFSPVDNQPTLNAVKAGASVPVKFSLDGNQGLDIFPPGYTRSRGISCTTSAPVDGIEQTVTAGGGGLSYDPLADVYSYVWKTVKSWAGSCRELELRLDDGTVHRASFMFK
jgi:galactose oxidase-like protein